MAQFYTDICGNFLLFRALFLKHFQLGFRLGKTDFFVLSGSFQTGKLSFHKLQITTFQEILVHPVLFNTLLYTLVQFLYFFQFFHAFFHVIKGTFHILISTHILPKYINIDFFFVQHVRVNKVLNIVDWLKCKRFWNQTEELIFNPSKSCCDHSTGFYIGLAPLADINVGTTEFCNGFHLVSVQEKII